MHRADRRWKPAAALAVGAGILTMGVGLLVITGWLTHHVRWFQLQPGMTPVAFNSGISFVLLGSILISRSTRPYAQIAEGIVFLLAAVSFSETMIGFSAGIDNFLVQPYVATGMVEPGRMAPNTAVCLMLLSAALLIKQRRGWSSVVVVLLCAVSFAIAVIPAMGYVLHMPAAQVWGMHTRMSPQVSVTILVAAMGVSAFCWSSEAKATWLALPLGVGSMVAAVLLAQTLHMMSESSRADRVAFVVGTAISLLLSASVYYGLVARERNRHLRALNAEVRRTNYLLSAVVEGSHGPISVKDSNSRYLLANRTYASMFGLQPAEMIGKHPSELLANDSWPALVQRDREVMASREKGIFEENAVIDGEARIFMSTKGPLLDDDGNVTGVFGISREITEEKRTQEALRQSEQDVRELNADLELRVELRTAELAAVNQELEAFAYSVSHDLRAPLRAMTGFSEAVLEDYGPRLDENGRSMLVRIQKATDRMSQLIDDMLVLSRVSRADMNRRECDLSEMGHAIAEDLRQEEPGRIVNFCIGANMIVNADAKLMRLALENLFRNSWKFSRTRESATIAFGSQQDINGTVYFVRDDGVGFDMQYADKLFSPFQRLHGSTEFEGTGVGLATVKRVITRHGGKVWAEAYPERGASFFFTMAPLESQKDG